jgi:precorrin-6A/cobalt-precorrin-6A reductase
VRLLILGGSTQATALARRIANRPDLDAVLSLAGRTRNPAPSAIPFRIGGFGGIAGLKSYLTEHRTSAVIDATHPFAAQMSRHAVTACHDLGLPLAAFTRPPWYPQPADRWTSVPNIPAAAAALGPHPRNVLLTVGALQLSAFATAPHHRYLIRTIDPTNTVVPHRLILARGPFTVDAETALMRDERIDVLVTKNSGGAATEAKLTAARALGIDVIIVERPPPQVTPAFHILQDVLAWIDHHRPAP